MDNTVYRQAAIDAINSYFGFNIEEEYGSAVQEVINGLPSVQPERKKGKWIGDNVATEHCSVCKHRFYISALFAVGGNDEPSSCPNCGADMRGE